jgi:hypothetical protein
MKIRPKTSATLRFVEFPTVGRCWRTLIELVACDALETNFLDALWTNSHVGTSNLPVAGTGKPAGRCVVPANLRVAAWYRQTCGSLRGTDKPVGRRRGAVGRSVAAAHRNPPRSLHVGFLMLSDSFSLLVY